jgi:hypothetical protein
MEYTEQMSAKISAPHVLHRAGFASPAARLGQVAERLDQAPVIGQVVL